jgi:hypothetical protein
MLYALQTTAWQPEMVILTQEDPSYRDELHVREEFEEFRGLL